MEQNVSLEVKGIKKSFSGNTVLDRVDFQLRKGEIHALLGHNGAGKSTFMKILLGVYTADEGTLWIHGKEMKISTPEEARDNGLGIVHQELNLFPYLTIAENMFLCREYTLSKQAKSISTFRGWTQLIDRKKMNEMCRIHLKRVGLDLDPELTIEHLSMGQRQLVEIAKGLSEEANILILDEPTSSLSMHETKTLFHILRNLTGQGVSIVFISHKMEEVFEICDRITVLRDGRLVGTADIEETDTERVIEMMIGKNIDNLYGHQDDVSAGKPSGDVVLKTQGLTLDDVYTDIHIEVRKGEIVGLAGLIGAGRTEVLESIFGLRKISGGSVEYGGRQVVFKDPSAAVSHNIGLVPEDRRSQGLFLQMDVGRNISIVLLKKLQRFGAIVRNKESAKINEFIRKLNIRAYGEYQPVTQLSGGNQQKVVIAKWLAKGVNLLLLDEPTRGVDVQSKSEIYALMKEFVREGGTVLMVSSELPEVIGLSDRIYTFKKGRITGQLASDQATENKIMEMIV